MLSQGRRKRPEVRWEFGHQVPTIDELKARSYPHRVHNSKPHKPIEKRSSKAQGKSITFLAQAGRPLQVERAATSARARQDTSTLSVAGDCALMRGRTSDTLACPAHPPIYINQPPLPHPRFRRSSKSGLEALRRREGGAELDAIDVPTTPSFGGAVAAAPSAGSGRHVPCCPASAAIASLRVCTDRGRRDGGVRDADGEDAEDRGLRATAASAAAACTSPAPATPAPEALAREGGGDPCSRHGLRSMA